MYTARIDQSPSLAFLELALHSARLAEREAVRRNILRHEAGGPDGGGPAPIVTPGSTIEPAPNHT